MTTKSFLTATVPLQAFARPILPSESSKGITLPGAPEKAAPKDVLAKPGKVPLELKTRRTGYSREFLNPDGTFTMEITPRPMNFKNKQGNWEVIDNQLVASAKPGFAYKNKANDFEVFFAQNNQSGDLVRFNFDDAHWLAFSPVDKFPHSGLANGSKMEYKNIKPGVDLKYTLDSNRLKEEILLQKYPGTNTYIFNLTTQGLTVEKDGEGIIWFKDEQTGNKLFHFAKPFAVDDAEAMTEQASLDIRPGQTGNELVLTIDDQWLKEAKYPVVIDPTIETSIQPGVADSQDTYISSWYPSNSYYTSSYLQAGNHSVYGTTRSFLKFNYLPSLATGARITNAYLGAYMYLAVSPDGTVINAHQVNSTWQSGTTTWSSQPSYNTTPESSINSTSNTEWQFNITNLVNKWYDGTAGNYGLMLKAANEASPRRGFNSGDNATNQPRLVIQYEIDPLGVESFWGYSGNVNVHNGNLVLSDSDVTLPGKGIPVHVTRAYNSRSASPTGSPYGYGWTYNVGMRLDYVDGGTVLFTDGDGTKYYFVKASDGNYTPPVGVYLTLTNQGGSYVIEEKSGLKYYFETSGRLDKIVDTDNNLTDISYRVDGTMDKITDQTGRFVTFNYLNGKVSSITGTHIPTVEYGYDAFGNLTSVIKKDAAGTILGQATFAYDAAHNITSVTDGENHTTTIGYTADDRVSQVQKQLTINGVPNTLTTTYSYQPDINSMVTQVTNPKGVVTQYTTNQRGNVTQVMEDYGTGKLNLTTSFQWDGQQNLVQTTEPKGNITVIDYNGKGDVERVNAPDNSNAIFHYNAKSDLIDSSDFAGRSNINGYDPVTRHQVGSANPLFATNVFRYGSDGNILGATNPLGIDENLLPNTGFENWAGGVPTNWFKQGTGGTVSDDTATKVNGSHSAKLVSTGSTDAAKASLDTTALIPVTPLTKYSLSWYVKTQGVGITSGGATATIRWFDGAQNPVGVSSNLAAATGTQDWQRKGARVNAPSNALYARIEITVNDAGTAWFDDVQLEYGSVINQHNLLTNESFEKDSDANGIPDNWSPYSLTAGDGVSTTAAHTGTRSFLINGSTANKFFLNQYQINLSGEAGTPIHFSGWSKAQGFTLGGTTYRVLLRLDYKDGTTGWYGTDFTNADHDWEYKEQVVAAAKDFNSVALYGQFANQTGQAWFDDFELRLDGAPNALLSAYNLLQNGSFERDADATNWPDDWPKYTGAPGTYDMSWVSSTGALQAYNGTKIVRIANVPDWAVVANIPLEPLKTGTTYTASAVIKTDSVTGSGALIKIDIYDAAGNYLGQKFSRVLLGTNDWTRVTVSLSESEAKTMYPAAAKVKAAVGTLGATNGVMYFDAVRLSEGGTETTYSYTADGNYATSVTNPLGNQVGLTPDSRGNVTRLTDPLNNSSDYAYDYLDRLMAAENTAGLRTEYSYDKNGNVTQVINKNKTTWAMLNSSSTQYNELGLVKNSTDPLGRVTSFEYDQNGNLSKASYPNGKGANYSYDAVDRLAGISYTGDTTTWSFQYDQNGNRTGATKNGTATTSYTLDNRNRITRVDFPAVGALSQYVEYQYNPVGQVLNIKNSPLATDPVRFSYDQGGNNVDTFGPNNSQSSFMRDEAGRVTKAYLADNTTGMFYIAYRTYDSVGQIVRQRTEDKNGQVLTDFSYTYDKNGNRTQEKDELTGGYTNFQYDAINQLTAERSYSAANALIKEITYQYDLLGNRTQKSVWENNVTTTTNYGYNAANEITSLNGSNIYTHDANGNLTADGQRTYIYDAEDQLIEVKEGANVIAQYEYNADGLRTKKVANGSTQLYYYNGAELAYIADGNNNQKFFFTRDAAGTLLNMVDYTGAAPNTYWYLYDAHGNVVGLADKNGNVVVTYKYDSWGNITVSTGTATTGDGQLLKDANPFRYAGYQYDAETGFYYLKARYYAPSIGRFLTTDPEGGNNLYAYCDNNPVSFVDPLGLSKQSDKLTLWQKVAHVWTRRWNNARNNYIVGMAQLGISPEVSAEALDTTVAYMSGDALFRYAGVGLKAIKGTGKVWKATNFAAGKLDDHFTKHFVKRQEWADLGFSFTKEGYLSRARSLLNSKISGEIDGFTTKARWVFRYNKKTNELAIAKPDGTIETLFRPKDGLAYWKNEKTRWD